MKLLGILCITAGCIRIVWIDIRRGRRGLALIRELAAALREMETSIRWKKETLPRVIEGQTVRELCGSYFAFVLDGLRQGVALQEAWDAAFSTLPASEKALVCGVELRGDEAHICGNLHMAAEGLQSLYQEKLGRSRQEEKLRAAVLFSGAGMQMILLI